MKKLLILIALLIYPHLDATVSVNRGNDTYTVHPDGSVEECDIEDVEEIREEEK